MSREILFKAKRRDNNEWIVGYYCKYGDNHCIIEPTEFGLAKGVGIIPETLCEFTGLYDKNGKRIWENDIVTAHFKSNRTKQTFRVIYDCGMFLFDNGCVKVNSWDIFSLKVVGNSIDNPELLTAERIGENEN